MEAVEEGGGVSVTDEWGRELGYCNACGEEAELDTECCEYDDVVINP